MFRRSTVSSALCLVLCAMLSLWPDVFALLRCEALPHVPSGNDSHGSSVSLASMLQLFCLIVLCFQSMLQPDPLFAKMRMTL